ncbi:MAG: endo alpha-1,4 polygalactosaminidase [Pseudomonadota bacterium]|nr:endo alpha-1,4 polygalactosaminidase [Pseudomonadota bacterium]
MAFGTSVASAQTWDWQLDDPIRLQSGVDMVDVDPDLVAPAQIASLKAAGVTPIAYVSVGTVENYRVDAGLFPQDLQGNTLGNWPNERYLDIRDMMTATTIMQSRFRRIKAMGFDGVEADNIDAYANDTGIPLTAQHAADYGRALALIAHAEGLTIGQKNAIELAPYLVDVMDFLVTEECYEQGWCEETKVYLDQGKPVYAAEYTGRGIDWTAACDQARALGIAMILHNEDLKGPAQARC